MPDEIFDRFAQLAQNTVGKIQVKSSALNPALWLCLVAMPICFCAAYYFRDDPFLKYLLIIAGIVPLLNAVGLSIYFAIYKTEKLQSEEYQLKHQLLQIAQASGERIIINPRTIHAIANPVSPRLIESEAEENQ